jgi:hypothetical protein
MADTIVRTKVRFVLNLTIQPLDMSDYLVDDFVVLFIRPQDLLCSGFIELHLVPSKPPAEGEVEALHTSVDDIHSAEHKNIVGNEEVIRSLPLIEPERARTIAPFHKRRVLSLDLAMLQASVFQGVHEFTQHP